jgi:hypothetical protein
MISLCSSVEWSGSSKIAACGSEKTSIAFKRYFVLAPVRDSFLLIPGELHQLIIVRFLFVAQFLVEFGISIPLTRAGVEKMAR